MRVFRGGEPAAQTGGPRELRVAMQERHEGDAREERERSERNERSVVNRSEAYLPALSRRCVAAVAPHDSMNCIYCYKHGRDPHRDTPRQ